MVARIACVAGIALTLVGSLLDRATQPEHSALFLTIRAITAGVATLILGLTYVSYFHRYETALFVGPIVLYAISIQVMIQYTGGYASPYYAGLCLCLTFGIVAAVGLWVTIATCLCIVGMWLLFALRTSGPIVAGVFVNNLFFLSGMAVLSIGTTWVRTGRGPTLTLPVTRTAGHDTSYGSISVGNPLGVRSIGRYEIVRRLGVGGMAEAYLGVMRGPAGYIQKVCVKCLLPEFSREPRFVELFMDEARITASMQHSKIVQVVDYGFDRSVGVPYLVLELVDGLDLRTIVRHGQPRPLLQLEHVLLIATDLALALEYAHNTIHQGDETDRRRVIHRDISPSNVLISAQGEIKLTDFGIAKELPAIPSVHTTGFKGKLVYMSPEQLAGKRLDARSDLFSLGTMLCECLVGERPFDGIADADTVQNIIRGDCGALSAWLACRQVVPEMRSLLGWLLKSNCDDRCPSAAALLERLEGITPPSMSKTKVRRSLGAIVREFHRPVVFSVADEPTVDLE